MFKDKLVQLVTPGRLDLPEPQEILDIPVKPEELVLLGLSVQLAELVRPDPSARLEALELLDPLVTLDQLVLKETQETPARKEILAQPDRLDPLE